MCGDAFFLEYVIEKNHVTDIWSSDEDKKLCICEPDREMYV